MWLSNTDPTLTYQWKGEVFDSVAHGNGVLLIIDNGTVIEEKAAKAYYGALVETDIVNISDRENYVGELNEDRFHGYGVYNKNGEIYIGNFQHGKPHGYVAWYKNGKPYYLGMWADGKFHGEGTLYKEDGSIKSGEWSNGNLTQTLVDVQLDNGHYNGYIKNNQPDGIGKMEYADGSVYSGKWKDGSYNGSGVYINGTDTIVGDWENGKICGTIIYRTDKFFYEGSMFENFPTGIGNLTVEGNSFYTGNWVDGKRAGIGDLYFANGDSYSGEWDNDQFSGNGKYIYETQKASYEGEWLDGLQNGQGYYRSPEFAYQGEWEKGWMDGDGTLVFKNGDKYEGTVHENLIDGIGTYTFKDGNFYEGEFVEGQMSGLGIFHFKDGTTFEGEFLNGKIYGDGTLNLVENGEVVSITGFWTPNSKFPTSASILFPSGDLYEGPIVNGFPTDEGTWTSAEERTKNIDKVENTSIHKANELYKRNRETINWYITGASAIVTTIEVASASTVVLAPVAAVLQVVNTAINIVDAEMAIGSAAIDAGEAYALGEDTSEHLKNLGTEVALNIALIAVPKAAKALKPLGKPLKNVSRSAVAALGFKLAGKHIAKETTIKFIKGKVYGKAIKLSVVNIKGGARKIERSLVRNKYTRKPMIAAGRILTGIKHQTISYNGYLNSLKRNPQLKEQLVLSAEGNSTNLGNNMRLLGTDKWVHRNERIRRYLGFPKRQVEPHHIIPSNPTTESGRKAREIWTKYFGSVDHPCNGIWLGRNNKKLGYYGLAKGSNHSPNSTKYEKEVADTLINTYKKYQQKYVNNPEMMQKILAETVDNLKQGLFKGRFAIGNRSHEVHTVLSIFKQSKGVATEAAQTLLNPQLSLAI
ncbi:MAG: AHH domain-containing protein [Duncaniella sp.]|uniref:AHH domain-containing protein n=1 Tax=Duncaniella sp. TaxID=2518496 RepID=UPI0023D57CD2|nr:AHH domain-containing protein [Duncaniella sp.]MDE6091186.1 AHH domain-containing protein [Duncaniella sp.]